jgi:hypothetical protein
MLLGLWMTADAMRDDLFFRRPTVSRVERDRGRLFSVLDRYRFRIHRLLAGGALEPREKAGVVVLVALHRESALHISG